MLKWHKEFLTGLRNYSISKVLAGPRLQKEFYNEDLERIRELAGISAFSIMVKLAISSRAAWL